MVRTMKLAAVLITAAMGVTAVLYRETAGESCGYAAGENVIA